jgi:hypothetical protein
MQHQPGKERHMQPTLETRARERGPQLLTALEGLLAFPQNQDSTDPRLRAAIQRAQTIVHEIRRPKR